MSRHPRSPEEFAAALEQDLCARGEPFSREDLGGFVHDFWPLILDNPDPARWAQAYLDEAVSKEPDPEAVLGMAPPGPAQPPEQRTRGLGWIAGLALLGLVFGGLVGAAWYVRDGGLHGGLAAAARAGLLEGAGVGAAVGAAVWAFFPYRRGPG